LLITSYPPGQLDAFDPHADDNCNQDTDQQKGAHSEPLLHQYQGYQQSTHQDGEDDGMENRPIAKE
jgi:hypothetical protein